MQIRAAFSFHNTLCMGKNNSFDKGNEHNSPNFMLEVRGVPNLLVKDLCVIYNFSQKFILKAFMFE